MQRTCGRYSVKNMLPVLLLAVLSASCKDPTPIPPPPAGSWLVFLCKASDAPQEPKNADYYRALFDSNQRDLMSDYFQTVSAGALDVSGTEVYGWFTMSVTTAQLSPATRTLITTPGRWQTLLDCKSAGVAALLATGRTIDPENYAGIIAVINVPVDAGAIGKDVVANEFEPASFYGHEMLHAMTYPPHLPHAHVMSADLSGDHSWNSGSDSEYGDCWDIMSYDVCIHSFNTATHGKQGPELNIAHKRKLGWVSPSRIFIKDYRDPNPGTVTLAPVSEASSPGFLMADVRMTGLGSYVIEYRVPSGFDRAVPDAAVVIRELRGNGDTYLVTRQGGATAWMQGERFTDVANLLSITVDSLTPQAATITINTRYSVTVGAGAKCGDADVGQVHQCPSGTACLPRVIPPPPGVAGTVLHSFDHFCL